MCEHLDKGLFPTPTSVSQESVPNAGTISNGSILQPLYHTVSHYHHCVVTVRDGGSSHLRPTLTHGHVGYTRSFPSTPVTVETY